MHRAAECLHHLKAMILVKLAPGRFTISRYLSDTALKSIKVKIVCKFNILSLQKIVLMLMAIIKLYNHRYTS